MGCLQFDISRYVFVSAENWGPDREGSAKSPCSFYETFLVEDLVNFSRRNLEGSFDVL